MKTSKIPSIDDPGRSYSLYAGIALILGIHLALGIGFIRSASPTYDEPVHLASGYSYWATGRYRLNIMDHPPLAEMLAAAPLLALGPQLFLQHSDWAAGRLYHYSDFFLYHNRVSPELMLNAARFFAFLVWTGLLAWAVLSWAHRMGRDHGTGTIAALGAAVLYAFNPALLSNFSLVTTDAGATVLFFLTIRMLAPRSGDAASISWQRWVLAGLCMGLANAAKFNMILLAPIALALVYADWFLSVRPRFAMSFVGPAVFLATGLFVLILVYRFDQFPLYWEGLSATLNRLDQGRSAFFLGRHSMSGFALYFPVALAIKLPVALWILAGLGVWRSSWRERLWIAAVPALYFAIAMTSKVQIGYRHVLPVIPFVILCAALGAAWLWHGRSRWGRFLALGLLLWQAVSAARVHPHYLAYFNELAGGPSLGYRVLVDSNLDWGQDLGGLAAGLKELGDPPIYLSYFGMGDPEHYGLRYAPVVFITHADRSGNSPDPSASGRVLLAVSATNLQCTYYADKTLFDWLKSRVPLRVFGYSIFLYDLTEDREGRRHLARLLSLSGQQGPSQSLLRGLSAS